MDEKITLCSKLAESVSRFQDQVAMQVKTKSGYDRITYQEFYQTIQSMTQTLKKLGLRPSAKIALLLESRPEWGILYFAILQLGAVVVPTDPQSTLLDIEFYLQDADCVALIASQHLMIEKNLDSRLRENDNTGSRNDSTSGPDNATILIKDIQLYPLQTLLTSMQEEETFIPLPDTPASILYTSGTTGIPKGVLLTHRNFCANVTSIEQLDILSPQHNVLSILPLHHSFPFMVTLLLPLFAGATITYAPLQPDMIQKVMQETRVTVLVGVPQLFALFDRHIEERFHRMNWIVRMLCHGLAKLNLFLRRYLLCNAGKLFFSPIHKTFGYHLNFFVSGGAKLDPTVARRLISLGFTFIEGYGLTETSPIVTLNPFENWKLGSVGKAIPNVRLKIFQPDSEGRGEIVIQGENVFSGYYRRSEETLEVLKEGWFYSGDIGFLDSQGYVWITGRQKEIIKLSSGKNLSPEEIEAYYGESPYIKELCILLSGDPTQEKLMAVIVPNFDYFRKLKLTNIYSTIKWDLETFSKNYAPYKRIMGFVLAKSELPRTQLGKLKRYQIQQDYADQLLGIKTVFPEVLEEMTAQEKALIETSAWKTLTELIRQACQIEGPIHLQDHLELDLGIDSLNRVELMAALQKHFAIQVPEDQLLQVFTVKELLEMILGQRGSTAAIPVSLSSLPLQFEGTTDLNPLPMTSETKSNIWSEILNIPPATLWVEQITRSSSRVSHYFTIVCYGILKLIFKPFWRLKVRGLENLTIQPPFILCSNHNSYFDGFILAASLPVWLTKQLFFMGFRPYFALPVVRSLVKWLKIIPIDPNTQLIESLQACAYALRQQKAVGIFPEGERSIDGSVKTFKTGVGLLAKELQVPLVPVYIQGSFEAWPRGNRFPRLSRITVSFGKPYLPETLKKKGYQLGAQQEAEAITLGIREEVMALQDEVQ